MGLKRKLGSNEAGIWTLGLLTQMVAEFPDIPIICEGRVHTPAQAGAVMKKGAWAAVVGTAITHPTTITSWFSQAIKDAE